MEIEIRERDASRRRYLQAGAVYFVIGCSIMAITALTPGLASPERQEDLGHLLIGLPFFALFAILIAFGDRLVASLFRLLGTGAEKAGHRGRWLQEKLTMLFTFSALVRTFLFGANGIGWKPGFSLRPFDFTMEAVPPMTRMLFNALLMLVILFFFFRAAWLPFFRRLQAGRVR